MTSSVSLKRSLLQSFVIVAAVPLLVVSIFVLFEITRERYRELDEKNMLLAKAVSGQVESFLRQPQATVAGLVALHTANPLITDATMQATLDALVEESTLFESFYLADRHGIVRQVGLPRNRRHLRDDFLGTDLSHLPFFQRAQAARQTTWSDTFLSLETGHTSIAIATAIDDHILVGHFSIAELTEFVVNLQLQEGIDVSIVDRSGAIIAHPDPILAASQVKIGHLPPVQMALLGTEGTQRYSDVRGEYLGSAVLIHGPEWITLVSQSVEQSSRPIRQTAYFFLAGTLAALLLAFLFSVIQARRLATPLSDLSDRARLVADGNYDIPVSTGGSREIEALAASFSRMATAIRDREAEIEKSRGHYRLLVETMREGLFVVNTELRLIFSNPRFGEMLGYSNDELVGRPLLEFLQGDSHRLARERFSPRHFEGKDSCELEWTCRDGNSLTTLVAPQPIFEDGLFTGSLVVVTDISRLKRSEILAQFALAEAEAARDQIDAILRSIPHSLVVTDLNGRVLVMNREAEMLCGQPQEKLAGLPIESVFYSTTLIDYLGTTLRQFRIQPAIDIELLHHGQREVRTFNTSSAFVGSSSEDCSGLVITLEDMTRERESDRLKSEFIAVAAHELNTPLTAIIGYAELLLGSEASYFPEAEQREFLQTILQRGYDLTRIVDDLLHLGRMESGRGIMLQPEAWAIEDLLIETAAGYRRENPGRTIDYQLPEQPTTLLVDRMRICQVLDNLLINAIKYSPAGSPITLTGGREGEWYRFSIRDQGIGMAAAEVARVFEKFYRVHTALSNIGGLGLGMSIVKNIVDAHHGQITIDSAPGRGTTVTVLLPLHPPA